MASVRLDIGSTPSTPSTGKVEVYPKADKKLYMKNEDGTEYDLTSTTMAASDTTFTPAGDIASTDVQAAIEELDAEKLPLSHEGAGGAVHADVTTSVAGFMTAADKTKLDGIAASAAALSTSTPQPIGTAAPGTGTAASKDDHVHAHGTQAGGSLHAQVTTSVDGFMIAADKTKLDTIDASAKALTAVTPSSVGTANSVGTGNNAAREDHVHAHGAQTDGTLHAVATGSVAGFLSASDKTKLDGVASSAAALTSSAPQTIGTANAVGAGTTAARENHVHDHGSQTTATHHAVATGAANGFMSSTDKTKLDGVATGATANSSDATLLARANHTGTQLASTISDFTSASQTAIIVNPALASLSGDTTHAASADVLDKAALRNTGVKATNVIAVSTNYTLLDADKVLLVNTSASRNITLPNPSTLRTFEIFDIQGTAEANAIVLVRNGSENINGVGSNMNLRANFGRWKIWSDGTNWVVS